MRKRLRKKLRRREFRELGFTLGFHIPSIWTDDSRDQFIYSFLDNCVEPLGLGFLGSGQYEWTGFLRMLDRGSVTAGHREAVIEWLRSHDAITAVRAGPLIDAWYSPEEAYEAPAA